MTDQSKEIEKLKNQISELSIALKKAMIQHAVDHNLLLALTYQCSSPTKLETDFQTLSKVNADNLLFSQLTEIDLKDLNELAKLVGKQLPKAPQ